MQRTALIIGSGLGGLATALRLSTRGYQVTVVEQHTQAGGRLNQLKKDGFTFDVGPSFFSMSYEFDELFRDCGLPNPLEYRELDPLYSVFFSGREEPYHVWKDLSKLAKEFSEEQDFQQKAQQYLQRAGQVFHDTEYRVIKRNFNGMGSYLASMSQVPLKHLPLMFRSMWSELERHFSNEEVRIIFSLVAFFLGNTPFHTPAVYSLLNYTELQHDGYWSVQGGMYSIVEKLKALLEERGVQFHFNTKITGCNTQNGQVQEVTDESGRTWKADVVVVNADAAAFRGQVLKRKSHRPQRLDKMKWTLAPFTIYLGVKGRVERLHHHNYFLGSNFRDYASRIFTRTTSPEKPYYYVNALSKSDPDCAPEGCENLFVLCPVPDLRYKPDWSDSGDLADSILTDLGQRIGFDLHEHTLTRTIMTPIDWQNTFGLYRGSGLGLAHGMDQIGAFRPKNKDEEYGNLYYVGASTTPGTGLPMVVISSRLTTERILEDESTV